MPGSKDTDPGSQVWSHPGKDTTGKARTPGEIIFVWLVVVLFLNFGLVWSRLTLNLLVEIEFVVEIDHEFLILRRASRVCHHTRLRFLENKPGKDPSRGCAMEQCQRC